jgi:hypothetical protein
MPVSPARSPRAAAGSPLAPGESGAASGHAAILNGALGITRPAFFRRPLSENNSVEHHRTQRINRNQDNAFRPEPSNALSGFTTVCARNRYVRITNIGFRTAPDRSFYDPQNVLLCVLRPLWWNSTAWFRLRHNRGKPRSKKKMFRDSSTDRTDTEEQRPGSSVGSFTCEVNARNSSTIDHPWNPWFHLRDYPSFTRGRWNNFGPQAVTNWSAGDLARENTAAGSLPLQGIVAWATVPRSPRVTTARNGVHALPVFRHPWKPSIIPKHPRHGRRSRALKGRVRCPQRTFHVGD